MTNIDKLKDGGILKQDADLNPEEEAAVESLDDDEIDSVISGQDELKNVVESHNFIAGIGTHHIVGSPDVENEP